MVRLSPARVLVLAAQVLEAIIRVEGIGEEDLIVDEDVRVLLLSWVQRLHVTFDDSLCALGSGHDEIVVNL